MDFTWIVFLVIAGFFTYKGYRQGILATVARVASFVVGYVASLLFGAAAASFLEKTISLNGTAAFIIGRVGVFVLVSFLMGFVFSFITKRIQKRSGKKVSTASALGGAGLGLGIGSAIAFLMVFVVSFTQDLIQPKTNKAQQASTENATQPQKSKNIVEQASRKIASKVVDVVSESYDMDPTAAKVAGAFITDPKTIMDDIQTVINSPSAKSLFNDPSNQTVLNSNNPAAIADLPAFKDMVNNPKMKQLAEASGFDAVEGEAFNQELAGQIGKMWSRAQEVRNDDRVQDIMRDPEFREKIQSNNPMTLIADPKFMEIVKILTSKDFSADSSASRSPSVSISENQKPSASLKQSEIQTIETTEQAKEEPTVHRWVDDDGRVHFSDKEPK